jgi:hypothetical protein
MENGAEDRDASDGYTTWCLGGPSVMVEITGGQMLAESVHAGLKVRNVRPAP